MTNPPSPSLPLRVAIVTGAGSGIGRVSAIALSRDGHAVALVGRGRAALDATSAELAGPALVLPLDLSIQGAAERVMAATLDRFGRLDVLVNNAGVGRPVSVAAMSPAEVEAVWRLNTFAPACLMLAAWPVFARQHAAGHVPPGPCIVNVSSMASFDPFPGFLAYAASKAALDSMTLSAAKEAADVGVRVFSVNPGAVETPMLRAAFDERAISRADTLDPTAVAEVICRCVRGDLNDRAGQRIPVLSPSAQAWYREWAPKQHAPACLP